MLFLPQGFDDKGMRIEQEYGVEHIVVRFPQRGQWFTAEEDQQLKERGIVSLCGHLHTSAYQYSIACCGENHLFRDKEDLDLYLENGIQQ
jgi:hypothetical protein